MSPLNERPGLSTAVTDVSFVLDALGELRVR